MKIKLVGEHIVTLKAAVMKNLLDYAHKNRTQGYFNDIAITTESGNIIPANKMVLSCFSIVFEKLFKTEINEKYEQSIDLTNFDEHAVKILVNFMYTGTINVCNENVLDVLEFAYYLKMDEVTNFCFDHLESAITVDNCFVILSVADFYENFYLVSVVNEFIDNNFDTVIYSNDFKTFSKEDLISCIRPRSQNSSQATAVCNGVISWTKYDLENRKNVFPELLQFIDFEHLSSDHLLSIASNEEFISQSHLLLQLFVNTTAKAHVRKSSDNSAFTKHATLLSFGGYHTSEKAIEICSFGERTDLNYLELPEPRDSHSCVKLDDEIYCLGGCLNSHIENDKVSDKAWRLDLREDKFWWKEIAPMKVKRSLMGASIFRNCIVVGGGSSDNVNSLSSSEIYVPALNEWRFIAPMNLSRSGNQLTVCNNKLYVLGGFDGVKTLRSVESLHDLKEKWVAVKPMKMPRRWFSAVNLKDFIFVIGGYCENAGDNEKPTILKSVERYDTKTESWSLVSSMIIERCLHSATVMDGKIYVVGGYGCDNLLVEEIECYDPSKDTWRIVGHTQDQLGGHSIVAVNLY